MGVDAEKCPVVLMLQVVQDLLCEGVLMLGCACGGDGALEEGLEGREGEARKRRRGGG